MKRVAATLLLAGGATAALACEPMLRGAGARTLSGQTYVVAWRAHPPIRVGEFFELEVAACSRRANPPATLRVDARMPAHRHGMNYQPAVAARGDGRFVVGGLLLHMPGAWELTFDLRGVDGAETLRANIGVP